MTQAESDEDDAKPAVAAKQQTSSAVAGRPMAAMPPQLVNMQTTAQPQRLDVDAEAVAAQHSTTEQPPDQVGFWLLLAHLVVPTRGCLDHLPDGCFQGLS